MKVLQKLIFIFFCAGAFSACADGDHGHEHNADGGHDVPTQHDTIH